MSSKMVLPVKESDKAINAAKRIGYMSTAFAATDFIASEPDRESTAIPLIDTEGLSGSDLALARLKNRVRYGAEGAAFVCQQMNNMRKCMCTKL